MSDSPQQLNPYFEAALDIAELITTKQAAYGDSFGQSGAILKVLYPAGIPADQLPDALTIVRIVDKLFRIATDKDALGESPFFDICGYSLLAIVRDKQCKEVKKDNS